MRRGARDMPSSSSSNVVLSSILRNLSHSVGPFSFKSVSGIHATRYVGLTASCTTCPRSHAVHWRRTQSRCDWFGSPWRASRMVGLTCFYRRVSMAMTRCHHWRMWGKNSRERSGAKIGTCFRIACSSAPLDTSVRARPSASPSTQARTCLLP